MKQSTLVRTSLWAILALGFAFIFAPIVTLVAFSFNSARFPSLPWAGFTADWYAAVIEDSDLIASLGNSVSVALTVGVIATILGSSFAYLVSRWNFRGKNVLLGLVMLPPAVPLLILALALLLYFNQIGMAGSLTAVIAGHVGLASAFVVGLVRLRLSELDQSLEEAAWNLGFTRVETLRLVVLPQALPAIGSAFFLAMAVSWDEFVISWFVSGFETTLPVKLYGVVNGYVSPVINAAGAIVFGITTALVVLALLTMHIGTSLSKRKLTSK